MRILLDTHTLYWSVMDRQKLSTAVCDILTDLRETDVLVSSISVWEIAKLSAKNKITLNEPIQQWIKTVLNAPKLSVIDVNAEIALESCFLPGVFHSDPADQIIVATARLHQATILTKDHKILAYAHVKSMW